MDASRVHRLLRLITMLQSGHTYTANDLACELQVSRRTVFRDLNMLEQAHIPYFFDPESGGFRIAEHFFLPPVNLTLSEALSLLMLAGRSRGAGRLPLAGHCSRAAAKIESLLPAAVRNHLGSVLDKLTLDLGPMASHGGLDAMFDQLASAIAARKVCKLVYLSFQDRKQLRLTVWPLRLAFVGRAWYLIAWSVSHRQRRTFKMGRIRKATVTADLFTPPDGVDDGEGFGQAWSMIPEGRLYDVHLRFEPKVAGNVAEVRWHASQSVEWNPDGTLDFRARVDGLGEITWWILGYGDQVEVKAPLELRRRLAEIASATADRHAREVAP